MNTIHNKVKEQYLVDKIYKYKHQLEWVDVMNELQKKVKYRTKILGDCYKHQTLQYYHKTEYNYLNALVSIKGDRPNEYRQGWAYVDSKYKKDHCWLMLACSNNSIDDDDIIWSRINKDIMNYKLV